MEGFHEIRASEGRGKPLYIQDWSGKLDAFLKFNEWIFYKTQARYRMKWRWSWRKKSMKISVQSRINSLNLTLMGL